MNDPHYAERLELPHLCLDDVECNCGHVFAEGGDVVFSVMFLDTSTDEKSFETRGNFPIETARANAHRLVAAWNACLPIATEALESDTLQGAVRNVVTRDEELRKENAALTADRDQWREAANRAQETVREISKAGVRVGLYSGTKTGEKMADEIKRLRAALKSVNESADWDQLSCEVQDIIALALAGQNQTLGAGVQAILPGHQGTEPPGYTCIHCGQLKEKHHQATLRCRQGFGWADTQYYNPEFDA